MERAGLISLQENSYPFRFDLSSRPRNLRHSVFPIHDIRRSGRVENAHMVAYLDRLILSENHIWRFGKVYDPEGILSTLPAIVTTLSGVLTGRWLLTSSPPYEGGVASASDDGVVLSEKRVNVNEGALDHS